MNESFLLGLLKKKSPVLCYFKTGAAQKCVSFPVLLLCTLSITNKPPRTRLKKDVRV